MRILFVAMPNSIHAARWINMASQQQGWDIHVFPPYHAVPHSDFKNITMYNASFARPKGVDRSVRMRGLWPFWRGSGRLDQLVNRFSSSLSRARWLAWIIRLLKPDIIHSLEIQHAGYLTLAARQRLLGNFPTWIVTNWGSDIYLFGRLSEHVKKIKTVLSTCDYYACECQRDVQLAKDMGLRGEVLPVLPNTGGFDLTRISKLVQQGPTSSRRLILLKGYQSWVGRALVALRAIESCANELQGYKLAIYLASNEVKIAAKLISQSTGISIDFIPRCSHDEMLRLFGRARLYIGLSISDAIPTSLLESIVMGAFPIQSCTSCADEWIENGKTGIIVPPEEPEVVAAAIRRAVSDDELVDYAAEQNRILAIKRLDQSVIKPQVVEMYDKIAARVRLKNKKGQG